MHITAPPPLAEPFRVRVAEDDGRRALRLNAASTGDISMDRLEANKKTVLDFYETALNESNFEVAAAHFGPRYTQHNPMIEDGIEGFRAFVQQLKQRFPSTSSASSPASSSNTGTCDSRCRRAR